MTIRETTLGPNDPNTAQSVNNLAALLKAEGDYVAAEPLYRRALAIWEKVLGPEHPETAIALNNLALLLQDKGDYAEAEPLYRRALTICERVLGPEHPRTALALSNLASLLDRRGDHAAAEPLYRRALGIEEKVLGLQHPRAGITLNSLADLLYRDGKLTEALTLAQQASQVGYPSRETYLAILQAISKRDSTKSAAATKYSFAVIQRVSGNSASAALSQLAVRFAAGSDRLATLVRTEQDLSGEHDALDKAVLAELSKQPAKRSKAREDSLREQLGAVNKRLNKARTRLSSEFPDYVELSRPRVVRLDEVSKLLRPDEALVAVNIATKENDGADYVWAITQNTADWQKLNTKFSDVAHSVARVRESLDPKSGLEFDRAAAYGLYRKVLGPVESLIRSKKHLIFVLNGALTESPTAALDRNRSNWQKVQGCRLADP